MSKQEAIAIGISGASGVPYALRLLECLLQKNIKCDLMISRSARAVFDLEAGIILPDSISDLKLFFEKRFSVSPGQLDVYADNDWRCHLASGSHTVRSMIICPCSSSCLSAIANGASDNLLERAADVMIKEKRQLILVHRETPLSVIHLENMLKLAKLGVTIMPAAPGFYHKPENMAGLVDFMVARMLDHLSIEHHLVARWGQ